MGRRGNDLTKLMQKAADRTKADRNDEHLDRKIEILSQGIKSKFPSPHYNSKSDQASVHEDTISPDTHVQELEHMNETLRRKIDALEREFLSGSPSHSEKKQPKRLPSSEGDYGTTLFQLSSMNLNSEKGLAASPVKTPGKKIRKFTARKWDLGDENELDEGYMDS